MSNKKRLIFNVDILMLLMVWSCFLLINSVFAASSASKWTQDSFEDFKNGTFDDSGQNIYLSRDGRIQIIHRYDINQDGFLDLFFGNTHDIQFHVAPVACYMSKDGQIERTELPIQNSDRVRAADLNRDGYTDLVFSIENDGLQIPRKFVHIIYGGKEGWISRRSGGLLPASGPKDIAIADLNADNWPDIVVLNSGNWLYQSTFKDNIRIYWGGEDGFLLSKYASFSSPNAVCFTSEDLNQDGFKDLVILNDDGNINIYWAQKNEKIKNKFNKTKIALPSKDVLCVKTGLFNNDKFLDIVVGSRSNGIYLLKGKSNKKWHKASVISSTNASRISSDDLDNDGFTDLVVSYLESSEAALASVGSVDQQLSKEVTILWGNENGFSDSTKLAVKLASATATGDFDADGLTDIVVAIYQGSKTSTANSIIYLNQGDRKFKLADNKFQTDNPTDIVTIPAQNNKPAGFVVCNSAQQTINELVPSYVYWGNSNGFDPNKRWEIPGQSAHKGLGADFNADGFVDLAATFTGHGGEASLTEIAGTNIFWGSKDGFDTENKRTVLKEPWMDHCNTADLNKDGYLDLVLGGWPENFADDVPAYVIIYYGSSAGFEQQNKKMIVSEGRSEGTVIADFNKDYWLDIAVTSYDADCARIFWGSSDGFSANNQLKLSAPSPIAIETADLNSDGWLDLLVGNYADKINGYFDTGLFIFWGSEKGFRNWDAQWLLGTCIQSPVVADFDTDGYLDIFTPCYHSQINREMIPSYLFWGAERGFSLDRKTFFILNSASGGFAGDFNHDGLLDLAVSCHTVHGDHKTESKVFYNDGQRFINQKPQNLPTIGSHYMWVQDMGHIYNRKYEQLYDSSILRWKESLTKGTITWQAETSHESTLVFFIRTAKDEQQLAQKPWNETENGTFYLDADSRSMQYRAVFKSKNGDCYPVLDSVTVELD